MNKTAPTLPLPAPLLALMGSAVVPLIHAVPWWAWSTTVLCGTWRLFATNRFALPARALRWLLTLLATLVIYARFHTLAGELPGISFFLILFGLKLLETTTVRDLRVLVFLSGIAFLGAVLFRPSPAMGMYALGFLLLSFVTLSVITQPTGINSYHRVRIGGTLLIQAVPIALTAFLLFPRIGGGLWGMGANTAAVTGLSRTLTPGAFNHLINSPRVVFRALFVGPPPAQALRYFRVYVLTHTNGVTWREGRPLSSTGYTEGTPQIAYRILLNATEQRGLPALDWPLHTPARDRLAPGDVLRAAHPIRHLIGYRLISGPIRRSPLSRQARRQDLALPAAINPRILQLAHRLAHGGPRARIAHTLGYFTAHHFIYTLDPPLMGPDPIAQFLFKIRAGYCEDYAAAFAILMRAEGVPTRVVVGYLGGTYNPDGQDVIVHARDAHAWTEVWVRGIWVRVDPTAIVAPTSFTESMGAFSRFLARGGKAGPPPSLWRRLHDQAMLWHDAAVTAWDNWVVDYNWHRQERLLHALGLRDADRASLAITLLLLIAGLGYGLKRFSSRSVITPDRALLAYHRYCRRLASVGLTRPPTMGPIQYANYICRQRPDLRLVVEHITTTYIATRYGDDPHALESLKKAVKAFRPRPLRR